LKVSPSLEDLESRKKKKFDSKEVEEELLLLTFSLLYDSVEEGTVEEIPVERSRKKRESGGIPLYSFSLDLISSSREKLEDEISRHRRIRRVFFDRGFSGLHRTNSSFRFFSFSRLPVATVVEFEQTDKRRYISFENDLFQLLLLD
jgi:hypothetical protein